MRKLLMVAIALALMAPVAAAQNEPVTQEPAPTEPGMQDEPIVVDEEPAQPDEQQQVTPVEQENVFQEEAADGDAAGFGLAWWGWLLIALIVVGLIAAIAVAMGAREPRETVVEREYRRPPP